MYPDPNVEGTNHQILSGLAGTIAPKSVEDMITGEELAVEEAIAGHIYQQRWPGILLVSQRFSIHLEE